MNSFNHLINLSSNLFFAQKSNIILISNMNKSCLKDFILVKKLGSGSFSTVYHVKRIADSNDYAMKKVFKNNQVKMGSLSMKQKQSAVNQVRLLASIRHENIIEYKQAFFDESSQTLCVVMQLAKNGDIGQMVKQYKQNKKNIQQKQIWKALFNMTKGLKLLHSMNIIHRDLKCANVFENQNAIYKLGDLNVSKVAKRGMARTQTGTPYYTSPQIWQDKLYDSKCDIWSLGSQISQGCVIYQMCSLNPPFKASNLKELSHKIQKGIFDRIPILYSEELWTLVQNMLKVNPVLRPSADQILYSKQIQKRFLPSVDSLPKKDHKLLQTIKLPRNLKGLKQKLPGSNYSDQNSLNKQNNEKRSVPKKFERAVSAKYINRDISNKYLPGYKPPIPSYRRDIAVDPMPKKILLPTPLSNRGNKQILYKNKQILLIPRVLTPNRRFSRNQSIVRRNLSIQNKKYRAISGKPPRSIERKRLY